MRNGGRPKEPSLKESIMDMETQRRVPRYVSPDYPKQLVISEKSVPSHIGGWLASKTREVVVVMADEATDVVKECVQMARSCGFRPTYAVPAVERQIEISAKLARA